MALKIRLARLGSKKKPVYRIVVANSASPRDGKFLEIIGNYFPLNEDSEKLSVKQDRAEHWLSVGATPTERVELIFDKLKIQNPKASKATLEKVAKRKAAFLEQSKARVAAKKEAEAAAKAEQAAAS